jgi:hypothetical protein
MRSAVILRILLNFTVIAHWSAHLGSPMRFLYCSAHRFGAVNALDSRVVISIVRAVYHRLIGNANYIYNYFYVEPTVCPSTHTPPSPPLPVPPAPPRTPPNARSYTPIPLYRRPCRPIRHTPPPVLYANDQLYIRAS